MGLAVARRCLTVGASVAIAGRSPERLHAAQTELACPDRVRGVTADIGHRLTAWRAIAGLAADGVTVFLTTQYLDEADRLADQIAVLNGGLLVAAGTAAELKRRVAAQRLDLTCSNAEAFEQVRSALANRVVHLDPAARTVGVATDDRAAQVRALLDQADPGRDLVASFAVRGATLDDVFFTLTAPVREVAHV
jgi:ABC-2 type transport system ATP-binding protein